MNSKLDLDHFQGIKVKFKITFISVNMDAQISIFIETSNKKNPLPNRWFSVTLWPPVVTKNLFSLLNLLYRRGGGGGGGWRGAWT